MTTMFYKQDAKPELLKDKKIAILGYGSQGHAHALNLHESGYNVVVGLRQDSSSVAKAEAAGLKVMSIADASKWADIIMILVPDTEQKKTYDNEIAPGLEAGNLILFAHGFNIRFDLINPPANVDVAMVAPKGPGHLVRRTYSEGGGVPALVAVHHDATGNAHALALAYADGIGATRAGVLETTFTEETETDLFGEQAVLCGGVSALVKAEMKKILTEIQDGTFAAAWIKENEIGRPRYRELREAGKNHPIEQIGKKLRAMMPFVSAGKKSVTEISGGDTD